MKCNLSTENTKTLDKIISNFPCSIITFRTNSDSLLLQLIQEDKSIIVNLTLQTNFFNEYDFEAIQTQDIPRIKFYKPKMLELTIEVNEYTFVMKWTFSSFTHKMEIFLADSELYKLEFNLINYVILDQILLYNLIKHFNCKNIELNFEQSKLVIKSKEKKLQVGCEINIINAREILLEIPFVNVKRILELYQIINNFEIGFGETSEAVNFVLEGCDFLISVFCATYA